MLQFAFKQVNGDLLNDPALNAPRKRSSWTFQISTSPATAHGGAGGRHGPCARARSDGAARQRSPRGQRGRGGAAASLGCVLRLHGGEVTYAYYDHGRAVERAVDTEEGALW
jgi:hypothetical protein